MRDVSRTYRAVGSDVGADVGPGQASKAEEATVAADSNLDIAFDIPRMIGSHHVFAAILGPLHRASDEFRRGWNQVILGIEFAARPESAADIDLDQFDGIHFQVERGSKHSAIIPCRLGRAPHRELARIAVPFGDKAARLHEHRGVPLNLEGFASRIIGGGESRVRIALECLPGDGSIRSVVLKQHSRHGLCLLAACDGGERLDIEIDMIKRVLCNTRCIRQHHRNGLADVAHLAVGKHRLVKRLELRKRLQPKRDLGNDRAKIGTDQDVADSGQLHRAGGVDRIDLAMGDGAAQNHCIELARPVHVGDIGPPAAQETHVLGALHRLANIGIANFHTFSF